MLTKVKLYFWRSHRKFQLWSQNLFFSKTFLIFEKWTKKMSKIEISKILLEKKNKVNIINSPNDLNTAQNVNMLLGGLANFTIFNRLRPIRIYVYGICYPFVIAHRN